MLTKFLKNCFSLTILFWNTFLPRDPNSFTKIFFLSALKISDPKYVNLPSIFDPNYFFQSSKSQTQSMFIFPKFLTPNMYMITPVIKVNEFPPGQVPSFECNEVTFNSSIKQTAVFEYFCNLSLWWKLKDLGVPDE